MEAKQSRRHFLKTCAQSGAACCVLMAWSRNLPAKEGPLACDQEYWKKWPDLYAFNKKNQARYLAEPGAVLREIKAGQ
jgi:hypothetical protein